MRSEGDADTEIVKNENVMVGEVDGDAGVSGHRDRGAVEGEVSGADRDRNRVGGGRRRRRLGRLGLRGDRRRLCRLQDRR